MLVYLIRHGKKAITAGNPALTTLGRQQAQKTAEYFLDKKIDLIVASPLKRTQQTAQIIGKKLQLPIKTDVNLLERANWEKDLSLEKFHEIWRLASQDRNYQPPIGDTSRHTGERIKKFIEDLAKTGKYKTILLVIHGGAITDFLRNLFSDDYLIKTYFGDLDHLMQSTVKECSVTAIKYRQSRFELNMLASTEHLADL